MSKVKLPFIYSARQVIVHLILCQAQLPTLILQLTFELIQICF